MFTSEHAGVIALHPCAITSGDTSKVQGLHLQEACQCCEATLCCSTAAHFSIPCRTPKTHETIDDKI